VRLDLVVAPQLRPDRLGAHLLRQRDADGLGFAVGVVGAEAEPQAVVVRVEHEFDFAARLVGHDLDRA
jgi:hypothetical protein